MERGLKKAFVILVQLCHVVFAKSCILLRKLNPLVVFLIVSFKTY